VSGFLATSSSFGIEIISVPQISPVPNAEILIIFVNRTDDTIINTTSVRTDSIGYFSAEQGIPRLNTSELEFATKAESDIEVVAYFDGTENIFPSYGISEARLLQLTAGPTPVSLLTEALY
jgi:hypothetical protein